MTPVELSSLDPTHGIAVFTDGSASNKDKSGGWAWAALDAFEGVAVASGFVPNTTIGRMELMAPTEALYSIEKALGSCEVLVFSDSMYVVAGAMDKARNRNVNKTWWRNLDRAIEAHVYVGFEHVKGHKGHKFNELVDGLAGEARKKGKAVDS